jgi:hypothetical protein
MNNKSTSAVQNLQQLEEERIRLQEILRNSKEEIGAALSPGKIIQTGLQSLPFIASQLITPSLLGELLGKKSIKKKILGTILSLVLPKIIEQVITYFRKKN